MLLQEHRGDEPALAPPALAPRALASGHHLAATLESVGLGILTFDAQQRVLFTNTALGHLLGIAPVLLTRPASVLDLLEGSAVLDNTTLPRAHEACQAAFGSGEQRCTLIVEAGQPRTLELVVSPLSDGQWIAGFEDSTARRLSEATAIESAATDALTGLPNRQLFDSRLATALRGTDPNVAVLLVDLDRFKIVNDTLGHPIGDALLLLVAKRLRSMVRTGDVVARLGGDEFALVIRSSASGEGPVGLARRIVDVLGRPYLIEGHLVNIGASVGIAFALQDAKEPHQLVRCADLALYAAKSAGRCAFRAFEPEMDLRALARRTLEIDLRRALVLREFELHYQPQIDLETQSVQGFEALIRWRHPGRGLVSPADFIPLAEEIGLIVPMGEWVIRQACQEAARWPGEVGVAVNVSAHQFEDAARLVDSIARSLDASGLPGRRLEVEITETVLLRDQAPVLGALHQLRAMGVRVAMDDFGTGYSSLSQLHSFPFDKIKIDRSFVKENGDPESQNAIVRAITALGVSLGMSTIAEGVETAGQLDRIRADGCTSVQGYLFSRPVPSNEIDGLIRRFTPSATTFRKELEVGPSSHAVL